MINPMLSLVGMALIPIIGYIVEGVNVDHDDVTFWVSYLYSSEDDDTGPSTGTYNPESAGRTVAERATLPDVGPIFEPYDPEVQALLAYE